ncbi:DUF1543 domain-containing protein [Chryseobacterium luquanense]|uniref:DUF1543 domain-containing protein n=1 Tax=Chryseobacterium luquanense TaxID=2983766 RepID=A0ABT3Y465_9FLAO|nr:DUF1543 domain-containing protein [Chryseobacterium luquanense]MCX8532934.1 DUF1543 domain-containing protein [Chryseobacterium luquanense]
METSLKLFYIILGATPKGRNIEQHDVFFGIAENLKDLVPALKDFWPEAKGKIHIDAYQEVKFADGYEISVESKQPSDSEEKLFFVNLGGYKAEHFKEFHEQHLMVGKTLGEVVKKSKATEFYQTMGFKGAGSHIDEKYGVDIDDIFSVTEILPESMKGKYSLKIKKSEQENQENYTFLGYLMLDKIK